MNIVFGPINSRRFGRSLGVDLSPSKKQCNFDCVYCELSANKPVEKQETTINIKEILNEVQKALDKNIDFDFLTLTANGEPSLYPDLKELVLALKKLLKNKQILILSNGSSVLEKQKFEALLEFDVVKLSLDSAISKSFYRIDKALKSINLDLMIEKMAEFSKEFKGKLIMEVLVVKGINDTQSEFQALNKAFKKIAPLRIDLSTIDRPPAYAVKAINMQELTALAQLIDAAPVLIAKRSYQEKQKLNLNENELLKMLHLRSQSEFDLANFSDETMLIFKKLLKNKKIQTLDLAGVKFYKV